MVSFNHPALKRLTLKKVLYHPLTWLAVGFHGLLLVVPFDPSAPSVSSVTELEPQEAETNDAIAVDILNLSDIAASTPAETPPPVTPPAPVAAAPPVAVPPVVPPIPSDLPAEVPADLPVEETLVEEAPIAETPVQPETPVEPQAPAYDPGQEQGVFVAGLDGLSVQNYTGQGLGLPGDKNFPKGNAALFINGTEPAAGALQAQWMDKSPDDIFSELQPIYQGVVFNSLDNYGDELLYELQNPNGQSIAFISLVDLKGSSLMVMWPTNPLLN